MTRRFAVLLASLVLLVTGCTTIPTSGPVEEVPVSVAPRGIDIAPQPPADGVQPDRLVEGFLQAMASPEGDYEVARQYLTTEAGDSWQPASAVVIDAAVTGEGEATALEGRRLGSLDGAGHFTSASEEFEHLLGVVEENGEWRISAPTDGLLLTRYIFERYYSTVTLYFMARAGSHVVPDPVHLPEERVTPAAIVEAAIAGPSNEIGPAVVNAVPAGVRLGNEGATMDSDGVVAVHLVGLDTQMGDDARRRLGAQLLWSLTAIPRVTGLLVTSGAFPFAIPGSRADGVLELSSQQGYQVLSRASTVDLYGVTDGAAGRIDGSGEFEPWDLGDGPVTEVAVSLDGEQAAVIVGARVLVGAPGGEMSEVALPFGAPRSPQFALGTLWLLADDPAGDAVLVTVDKVGVVSQVATDLPEGVTIAAFAVSPSQARAALLVDQGGETRLGVATVAPSDPVAVGGWAPLPLVDEAGADLTSVTAVAWHTETSLAVTGSAAGLRSVYSVEEDGSLVEELGPFSVEVAELTAMARLGGGSIALRTTGDTVWRYEARTRWTRVAEAITAIAFAS